MAADEKETNSRLHFWKNLWDRNRTPWHLTSINLLLGRNLDRITGGRNGIRVLVPLCGKALEMKWLADKGHYVVGVECSPLAIEGFLADHSLEYSKEAIDQVDGVVYKTADQRICIYCCDFFALDCSFTGAFDAVWDRGSLNSIRIADRQEYCRVMLSLLARDAVWMVETFDFDDSSVKGPPYLMTDDIFNELLGDSCTFEKIDSVEDLAFGQIAAKDSPYFYNCLYVFSKKMTSVVQ